MRLVSALCLCVLGGQSLVRRHSLRGSGCECRPANFSSILENGTVPVHHNLLYPESSESRVHQFPAEYGSKCGAWDDKAHPACQDRRQPPSWCLAEWCYVDESCKEADVRRTVQFASGLAEDQHLYYSYSACGSVDTATPESCLARDERACRATPNCAWQAASEICQSELCQCQHGELDAPSFAADYGAMCGTWDHDRCRAFAGDEEDKMPPDESLGLWCCMSFCFVKPSCPSASPHPALKDKYVSYVACPNDAAALKECPVGTSLKDAHGHPLPISSAVSDVIEAQAHEEREAKLKKPVEATPLHEAFKAEKLDKEHKEKSSKKEEH